MINGLILSSLHCQMLLSGLKWFDRLTTNGLWLALNRSWHTIDIRPTDRTITPFALSLSKGPSILSSSKGLSLLGCLRWFDRLTTNGLWLTLYGNWSMGPIRPTHQTTTPFALSLSKGPSILSSSKGLSRWKGLSLSGCLRWFDRLTTNGLPNARTSRYCTNGIPNARTSRYCTNGLPNTRTSRYCTNRLPNARTDRSCTNRSLVQARAAGFVNGLLLNESAL